MKVSELKEAVVALNNSINLGVSSEGVINSEEVVDLAAKLTDILDSWDDELSLSPEHMPLIKAVLNDFWGWAMDNLPHEQWEDGIEVQPWLMFQKILAQARLLAPEFHHPVLYMRLKTLYALDDSLLKVDDLMSLLICTSRMLGYAQKDRLDDYPLVPLQEKIKARMPKEIEKIRDIVFLLRATFYLIYRFCNAEQLALLPELIYFRNQTTDEERRSESAIFKWLSQEAIECLAFFDTNQNCINMRSIQEVSGLCAVSRLMPWTRIHFLHATEKSRWIYPFIKSSRINGVDAPADLLDNTFRLLEADFATERDQSYGAALTFISKIKLYLRTLTKEEAKIVHSATSLFCLEHYIKQRKEEPGTDSFFSFSGKTKWNAAEKKQSEIRGGAVAYGFFEKLALQQGRLKDAAALIDDKTMELTSL